MEKWGIEKMRDGLCVGGVDGGVEFGMRSVVVVVYEGGCEEGDVGKDE